MINSYQIIVYRGSLLNIDLLDIEKIVDIGSGFFINSKGLLVTAGHVVKDVDESEIRLYVLIEKITYELRKVKSKYQKYDFKYPDWAICKLIHVNARFNCLNFNFSAFKENDEIVIEGITKNISGQNKIYHYLKEIGSRLPDFRYYRIPGKILRTKYYYPRSYPNGSFPKLDNYSEGILKLEPKSREHNMGPKNMSGGSVFNNLGEVIGIFVGGYFVDKGTITSPNVTNEFHAKIQKVDFLL
ncbi:MAG: serine protease [Salinivirgaceae bacterium]|nr:serine protease [Salinivirgaceae bacterium]